MLSDGTGGADTEGSERRSSSVSAPGSERRDEPGEDGGDCGLSASSGRHEQERLLGDDGGI